MTLKNNRKNSPATLSDLERVQGEIIEAVGLYSKKIEQRFDNVEQRFDKIESTMVTKDYLDDKLADLRGDLVVLMRKEDTKLKELVDILHRKNILKQDEVVRIFSLEPFARMA